MRALRVRKGISGLRDLCGTSEVEGTDEFGIQRALLAYRFGVDVHHGESRKDALDWLTESLSAGRPVILCVDRWLHWVTLIGVLGRQFVGYDPAGWQDWRGDYCGVFVSNFSDLAARWKAPKRARKLELPYYGIAVGAPPL